MRDVNMNDLNKTIDDKKKEVNYNLAFDRSMFCVHKTARKRDPDEVKALTEVARASLQRAEREGKFVKLRPKSIYYDPSS